MEEWRLYARFPIGNEQLASARSADGAMGRIEEASFGGCSVQWRNLRTTHVGDLETLTLRVLDVEHKFQVQVKSAMDRRYGYCFMHDDTLVLEILQKTLKWIRLGSAMKYAKDNGIIRASDLPSAFGVSDPWPASFTIDGEDASAIPNFILAIQNDKVSYRLRRSGSIMKTWHSVWPGGVLGDLREINGRDRTIMRIGAAFLIGYSGADMQSGLGQVALEIARALVGDKSPDARYKQQGA